MSGGAAAPIVVQKSRAADDDLDSLLTAAFVLLPFTAPMVDFAETGRTFGNFMLCVVWRVPKAKDNKEINKNIDDEPVLTPAICRSQLPRLINCC